MTPVTQASRTREAILERAVDLASEEGLEGLTIGRLAGEMEMSKSGLFGHFGSKQELQLATIEAAARRFIAEVVAPTGDREPGEERLRALCDGYLEYLERGVFSGGCFWGAVSPDVDGRPGPLRDAVREGVDAWLRGLQSEAEQARYEDPAQLVFELHSIAQGANSTFQLFDDREAFTRARRAFDRLLAV